MLPGLGSYLEAFQVLCGSRSEGFGGPLPIRLSEIESFCRLTGWRDPEAVAELVAIVQALDATYLENATKDNFDDKAGKTAIKGADYRAWAGRGKRVSSAS